MLFSSRIEPSADTRNWQAYELSVLTGTQVLLLVVSETGLVYTFTTPKLQPLVTKAEGKNLIQVRAKHVFSQVATASLSSRVARPYFYGSQPSDLTGC